MFGVLDNRGRQVSAGIEEIVLNLQQYLANLLTGVSERDRDTDGGIGLVTVGIRREPRVIL
jgi:hypothetical protein